MLESMGAKLKHEMAEAWSEKISDKTIGKALKKIGFTQTKTYGYRERDEQKRLAFLAKIHQIPPESRVYIDESGVDNRVQKI